MESSYCRSCMEVTPVSSVYSNGSQAERAMLLFTGRPVEHDRQKLIARALMRAI